MEGLGPFSDLTLTHLCVLRLELVEKPLLQILQICGFSPVWVLMCLFSRLGRSKVFPQTEQGSMVFSRGRLKKEKNAGITIDLLLLTCQGHPCEGGVGGREGGGWGEAGSLA